LIDQEIVAVVESNGGNPDKDVAGGRAWNFAIHQFEVLATGTRHCPMFRRADPDLLIHGSLLFNRDSRDYIRSMKLAVPIHFPLTVSSIATMEHQ
jgi:hypothetical protein